MTIIHYLRSASRARRVLTATTLGLLIAACSASHNWRDYTSQDAPYRIMFPDKPSIHKRTIDLDGMKVEMTMTAVDTDGTMFAVGSAVAPDAAHAQAALRAMQTALVRNIGATVTSEKASAAASTTGGQRSTIDIEARGAQQGTPMKLIGHFEARDKRFYQVIVMGKEKNMPKEAVDQFISSFKLL
jgi:hypothetical protein